MARRKFKRKIVWFLALVLLASTLFWVNFESVWSKISQFFSENGKETGQKETRVASKPAKEEILPKVNGLLRKEGDILPGADAEIIGVIDLNDDGVWEIVANVEAGGAYTTLFTVMEYKNANVSFLNLVDREGERKKARFTDGSSVRHANAFKIFNDERGKAYVQLTGESDPPAGGQGTKWTWGVAAYSWDGHAFAYNRSISNRIISEDPQKIFQEDDYLNQLFRENRSGEN